MTEIVEQAAKNMCRRRYADVDYDVWETLGEYDRQELLADARAAIEAMREPTPRMCDMGEGYNIRCGCPNCDHEASECIAEGYRAMIDEALAKRK